MTNQRQNYDKLVRYDKLEIDIFILLEKENKKSFYGGLQTNVVLLV